MLDKSYINLIGDKNFILSMVSLLFLRETIISVVIFRNKILNKTWCVDQHQSDRGLGAQTLNILTGVGLYMFGP